MTWLSETKWREVQGLVPILCVDVLPWTKSVDGGPPRGFLIRRRDERGDLGWTLVGGRVNLDETLDDAVGRHIRSTLGSDVTWAPVDTSRPCLAAQYFRTKHPGHGFDPRKHAVSLTYLVEIDGSVHVGGEAHGGEFFPLDQPPSDAEVGFSQAGVIRTLLACLGGNLHDAPQK